LRLKLTVKKESLLVAQEIKLLLNRLRLDLRMLGGGTMWLCSRGEKANDRTEFSRAKLLYS